MSSGASGGTKSRRGVVRASLEESERLRSGDSSVVSLALDLHSFLALFLMLAVGNEERLIIYVLMVLSCVYRQVVG